VSLRPGTWTVDLLAANGDNTVIATIDVEVVPGETRRAILTP
jgi:hypothetical protein